MKSTMTSWPMRGIWMKPEAAAGPALRHPHEAGAVLVLLAQPVPVELDFDPRILVGENLLARRPDDRCRLRPAHDGSRRDPRRTIGQGGRGHSQNDLKILALGVDPGSKSRIQKPIFGANHQIFLVLIFARKAFELESATGKQAAHGSNSRNALVRRLNFLAPDRGYGVTTTNLQMCAGLAVNFTGGQFVTERLSRISPSGRRPAS